MKGFLKVAIYGPFAIIYITMAKEKNKPLTDSKSLKRILIVDDDPTITKLIESRLKANGYDAIVANDASIGLEYAIKHVPNLIVLDVMMPIINGYNLCTLLKSEEKTKKIPVIMLTSRGEDQDKAIGKSVGVDAYLTKPVVMDELLAKVAELIK